MLERWACPLSHNTNTIAGWSFALARALEGYGIDSKKVFRDAGINLDQAAPRQLAQNSIENNGVSIRNTGGRTIDATNNWWGTQDEGKIASTIQKDPDNPGEVRFRPILTSRPARPTSTGKAG